MFTPDAMLREGVEDETAFVFTLKVSKNPLRQVFNADVVEPPLPPPTVVDQEAARRSRRSPVDANEDYFYLKKQN